jgi:hypothetical protein
MRHAAFRSSLNADLSEAVFSRTRGSPKKIYSVFNTVNNAFFVALEVEIIIPHFCNGGFLGLQPESIEGFIDDQAFSTLYDLARRPPPYLSCQYARPATHRKSEKRDNLPTGGGGPNYTTARKPGPL